MLKGRTGGDRALCSTTLIWTLGGHLQGPLLQCLNKCLKYCDFLLKKAKKQTNQNLHIASQKTAKIKFIEDSQKFKITG